MRDRVSIAFKNEDEISITLFSHWDGMDFVEKAKSYVRELKKELSEKDKSISRPIDRMQPNTVMVDFVRWAFGNLDRIDSNYYFGKDENDGDNSDNGHHLIDLRAEDEPDLTATKFEGGWIIPSDSQKGTFYKVFRKGDSYKCTCPAGIHGRPCKHLAKAEELDQ